MRSLLLVSFLFLASCKSLVSAPPLMEQTPDVINKPTQTVVAKETTVELPKNSWIKTDPESKTEVKLEEDTIAVVKEEAKEEAKEPVTVVLPKNTSVLLPENTYLQTSDITKVEMEAKTEVILPVGTEITITKVNWYAILFYCVLIVVLIYFYLSGKTQDKDGDGFEDTKEDTSETKKSDSAPS